MPTTPTDHQGFNLLDLITLPWTWIFGVIGFGGVHAGRAQAKLNEHDAKLEKFEDVPERIAKIEQKQEHHGEMLSRILNILDK